MFSLVALIKPVSGSDNWVDSNKKLLLTLAVVGLAVCLFVLIASLSQFLIKLDPESLGWEFTVGVSSSLAFSALIDSIFLTVRIRRSSSSLPSTGLGTSAASSARVPSFVGAIGAPATTAAASSSPPAALSAGSGAPAASPVSAPSSSRTVVTAAEGSLPLAALSAGSGTPAASSASAPGSAGTIAAAAAGAAAVALSPDSVLEAKAARFLAILQARNGSKPLSISQPEMFQLFKQIEENVELWKRHQAGASIYLKARTHGLGRSVQINEDGSIFIHFTKKSDPSVGSGSYKNNKFAINFSTEELWVSAGIDNDLIDKGGEQELRGVERTKGIPGFIQGYYPVQYTGNRGKTPLDKVRMLFPWKNMGSLSDYLKKGALSADELDAIVIQILQITHEMMSRGLLHRDIKPGNILLHREDGGRIQVDFCDLGPICRLKDDGERSKLQTTRTHRSPEMAKVTSRCADISDHRDYVSVTTHDLDMWSVGCVIAQLYNFSLYWNGYYRNGDLVKMLTSGREELRRTSEEKPIPAKIKNIITRMLEVDPDRRLKTKGLGEALAELQVPGALSEKATGPIPASDPLPTTPTSAAAAASGGALFVSRAGAAMGPGAMAGAAAPSSY